MNTSRRGVVLVVEDEPDVAETYELWLADEYEVRVAESGERALELLDDDVDVVLLDRMMPGMSGDEVLDGIRERGFDVGVAMVTAVDPDFDIVEMGFDDYVQKPPSRDGLREVVDDLLERNSYAAAVRDYQSLLAKREALREQKPERERRDSEAFDDLERRIDVTRDRLSDDRDRLADDATFVDVLRDLTDEGREGR